MIMLPSLRRFALTAHVVSSVGWLGAVAGFLGPQLVGDASAALLVLIVTCTLSVYKPWGLIGSRAQGRLARAPTVLVSFGPRVVVVLIGVLLATIIVLHLTGHGLGPH